MAQILAESFHAELWTGHSDEGAYPDGYFGDLELKSLEAYESSPRILGFSKILQLWWAFAHFPVTTVKWTVFLGSLTPLANKRIAGKKIFYCLTPPRLLYDQRKFMLRQIPKWQRPFLKVIMSSYRSAYKKAVGQMDVIISISKTVKDRVRRFLGYESQVIYPPCDTQGFRYIEEGDYYLSTARLDSLKRVDLIVRAFLNIPDSKLIVVSGGPQITEIEKLARKGKNIQVVGWVDEQRLKDLIGRCIATVYIPRDEDFGLSPVESMAAGKPVIGIQEGAIPETVVHEKTGFLIRPNPTYEDIIAAVHRMDSWTAVKMREACEERSKLFDTSVFIEEMRQVIERSCQGSGSTGEASP
ncbi:MAG: glycosyltransferase [Pseudomonadota bacterium]